MARIPVDPDETLRLIEQFDRTPFQELLAHLLSRWPEEEALQVFANKYPDRHMQAITMGARLVGYAEAPVVSVSVQARLNLMSDAQVLKELAAITRQLKQVEGRQFPALDAPKCAETLIVDCISNEVERVQTPPSTVSE